MEIMNVIAKFGHAGAHWSLGGLVLVALASSEYSGAGVLVALPIAALGVTCAALSDLSSKQINNRTNRKASVTDYSDFLAIWLDILEHLVASATCARVASATVDYTSEGRLREWLLGIDSHSLGEPWPDILGIAIIAVVTAMFMLGLEKSFTFCILLYVGLSVSLIFFTSVGLYHADIIFWNWAEDFKLWNWGNVLTAAALISYAFTNTLNYNFTTFKRLKIAISVILPLICFTVIALVFTLMSHFKEVAGTAIPLVRVFEVRDVDWARPIMATCTICVVCISLTELMPYLYNLIVQLAGHDWQILASPILYKNSLTGAPVLAIFTAGSLCSILAFACPLWYLVRLVNTAGLLKCAIKSSIALYNLYRPEFNNEQSLGAKANIEYSILNNGPSTTGIRSKSKTLYNMIPQYLKKSQIVNATSGNIDQQRKRKGVSGDKEYLLLDHYGNNSNRDSFQLIDDSASDSDVPEIATYTEEESSSSTDIDAVVQEYKDRIKVTAVNNLDSNKTAPTFLTSQIVLSLIFLYLVTSSGLSIGVCLKMMHLIWPSLIISLVCIFVIISMPKKNVTEDSDRTVHIILQPCVFLIAIFINVVLAVTLLIDIWPAIILWILAGSVLFSRCLCCNCDEEKERTRLYKNTECSVSGKVGANSSKYLEVDTIIIPR